MLITPLRIAVSSVIASAALVAATTSAFAQPPMVSTASANENVHSATVNYADLNLMTETGVAKLTGRVRMAAKSVCDVRNIVRPLSENMAVQKCFDGAMARATDDIQLAVANIRSGNQLASNETGGQTIAVARR